MAPVDEAATSKAGIPAMAALAAVKLKGKSPVAAPEALATTDGSVVPAEPGGKAGKGRTAALAALAAVKMQGKSPVAAPEALATTDGSVAPAEPGGKAGKGRTAALAALAAVKMQGKSPLVAPEALATTDGSVVPAEPGGKAGKGRTAALAALAAVKMQGKSPLVAPEALATTDGSVAPAEPGGKAGKGRTAALAALAAVKMQGKSPLVAPEALATTDGSVAPAEPGGKAGKGRKAALAALAAVKMQGKAGTDDPQVATPEDVSVPAPAKKKGGKAALAALATISMWNSAAMSKLPATRKIGHAPSLIDPEEDDNVDAGLENGGLISDLTSAGTGMKGDMEKGFDFTTASKLEEAPQPDAGSPDLGYATSVFSGMSNLMSIASKIRQLVKKKNLSSAIDLLLSLGQAAQTTLLKVVEYSSTPIAGTALKVLPGIGPAISTIQSAKSLHGHWKSYKKLNKLELKAKASSAFTGAEDEMAENFKKRMRVQGFSLATDLVLDAGSVAGSFFPPAGTIIGMVKGAKSILMGAHNIWRNHQAEKERHAAERTMGSDAGLSTEDTDTLNGLKKKLDFDAEKSRDSSVAQPPKSIQTMVKAQLQLDDLMRQKQEEEAKGASKDVALLTTLNASIRATQKSIYKGVIDYNETFKGVTGYDEIGQEDIMSLASIHKNTIDSIIHEVETNTSILRAARNLLATKTGSKKIAEEKFVIYDQYLKGKSPAEQKVIISELHLGKTNMDYFFTKSRVAVSKAVKGRKNFSSDELKAKVTKILKAHSITQAEIDEAI